MRWRDIRFEKPTAADGDSNGSIVQMLTGGAICCDAWDDLSGAIAWCTTNELFTFDPIPDPPEGWRFVQDGEAFDSRAKFWLDRGWEETANDNRSGYNDSFVYIVPIDPPAPPEPQYRPFKDAAEFAPHRDK